MGVTALLYPCAPYFVPLRISTVPSGSDTASPIARDCGAASTVHVGDEASGVMSPHLGSANAPTSGTSDPPQIMKRTA